VANPEGYRNSFTGKDLGTQEIDSNGEFKKIAISEVLGEFPVALYLRE
jgi:hypothetical protein